MVGPLEYYDNKITELQKNVKNFVDEKRCETVKNEVTLDILAKTGICKYTKDKYIVDIITNGLKLGLKE